MNLKFLAYKATMLAEWDEAAKVHEEALDQIQRKRANIENHTLNFVYDDLDKAKSKIEDHLHTEASNDCGDGCHGDYTFTRDYIVDGIRYICTGKFEYNDDDNGVYFVDNSSYEHKEMGPYGPHFLLAESAT